tara:strand:+ start:966 stop:1181 length:216 start_codon:yes stop_codon:yes gene_type:complete
MTLQRIEIQGVRHLILHFKFAINNPDAKIYEEEGFYLAEINGVVYVLGWLDSDGTPDRVANTIKNKIKTKE